MRKPGAVSPAARDEKQRLVMVAKLVALQEGTQLNYSLLARELVEAAEHDRRYPDHEEHLRIMAALFKYSIASERSMKSAMRLTARVHSKTESQTLLDDLIADESTRMRKGAQEAFARLAAYRQEHEVRGRRAWGQFQIAAVRAMIDRVEKAFWTVRESATSSGQWGRAVKQEAHEYVASLCVYAGLELRGKDLGEALRKRLARTPLSAGSPTTPNGESSRQGDDTLDGKTAIRQTRLGGLARPAHTKRRPR